MPDIILEKEHRSALTAAIDVLADSISDPVPEGSSEKMNACPIHGSASARGTRAIAMLLQGRNESARCLCENWPNSLPLIFSASLQDLGVHLGVTPIVLLNLILVCIERSHGLLSVEEPSLFYIEKMLTRGRAERLNRSDRFATSCWNERENRLLNAIRSYTFDEPDDKPNGPTEAAIDDMASAVDQLLKVRGGGPPWNEAINKVSECCARWCSSSADDAAELLAASRYFFPGRDLTGEPSPGTTSSMDVLEKKVRAIMEWSAEEIGAILDDAKIGYPSPTRSRTDWEPLGNSTISPLRYCIVDTSVDGPPEVQCAFLDMDMAVKFRNIMARDSKGHRYVVCDSIPAVEEPLDVDVQ